MNPLKLTREEKADIATARARGHAIVNGVLIDPRHFVEDLRDPATTPGDFILQASDPCAWPALLAYADALDETAFANAHVMAADLREVVRIEQDVREGICPSCAHARGSTTHCRDPRGCGSFARFAAAAKREYWWEYVATSKSGKIIQDTMSAPSWIDVCQRLRQDGITPVAISARPAEATPRSNTGSQSRK